MRGIPSESAGRTPGRLGTRTRTRTTVAVTVGLLAAALSGCVDPGRDQFIQFLRSPDQIVAGGTYRVAPPDAIRVNCPIAPEIDGASALIRPDGKISLRLLGEIFVAGLTTEEIADKIAKQLSRYYVEPEVVVDIARYASQYYYVFGEVAAPGRKLYTGRDTLMGALAAAKLNNFAWQERIRVTRPSEDPEERATIVINLKKMLESGTTDQDVLLQPGDIVEVPPTPIAWLGHQVRALLYPVTPVLDAYSTPADFLEATDTYEDRWGEEDSNSDDNGFLRRR